LNTRPNPLNVQIDRKSDKLAIVNLAFDEASAESCARCQLCKAEPGPATGEFECTNETPTSAVASFFWGARVDRATPTLPSMLAEAAKPARSRRARRPPSAKSLNKTAATRISRSASRAA
jgi:hypothetical protein